MTNPGTGVGMPRSGVEFGIEHRSGGRHLARRDGDPVLLGKIVYYEDVAITALQALIFGRAHQDEAGAAMIGDRQWCVHRHAEEMADSLFKLDRRNARIRHGALPISA